MNKPPRVFISYSHDSDNHKSDVRKLSDWLRFKGIDCRLDAYEDGPEEGWPLWINSQIAEAEYVLLVCTEIYNRRVTGQEKKGFGLGVSWEGQLITQHIYEKGGKNKKFIPIILREADSKHIPHFLSNYSRYCTAADTGLRELYRRLTGQPEAPMPPLGPIKSIPPKEIGGRLLLKAKAPVAIWLLPRGFLLMDDLISNRSDNWSTLALHYNYEGIEIHGTHYHPSYRWRDKAKALDGQLTKLQIPRGDWDHARFALYFLMDVRETTCSVLPNGTVRGSYTNKSLGKWHASIHRKGDVPLPQPPVNYLPLARSGSLRDLALEANDLLDDWNCENKKSIYELYLSTFADCVSRIRRRVRVEAHQKLGDNHPAFKNLEEVIIRYQPKSDEDRAAWLTELISAAFEASRSIEKQE